MGSIFLFIIFVVFLFIFLGLSFLRSIFKAFFKPNLNGRQPFMGNNNTGNTQNKQSHSTNSNRDSRHHQHKKVFGKDEGEYVDFEEIKQ